MRRRGIRALTHQQARGADLPGAGAGLHEVEALGQGCGVDGADPAPEDPGPHLAAGEIEDRGFGHLHPAHPDQAALPVTTAVAVNIPRDQSSFATQALLKEAQEDGAGDMADNLQQPAGKTKLRGLFRRVTRAFGKTADRDDDGQRQLLISAFQVALK